MRICSLLPSATEIAFALGLGDDIVAVTHECDYPPQARAKPVVVRSAIDTEETSRGIEQQVSELLKTNKSLYTIDVERFKEASPDLVLTQELCDVCALDYREVAQAAQCLSPTPRIVSLAPGVLSDVLNDIARVGQATGKEREAESLVQQLRERIDRVEEQAATSDFRPRVACLEWLDPLYSAGHWVPEMVALAGGEDGLARTGQPSARIQWERVLDFAPEVMVLMPCGFGLERTLKEAPRLATLPRWNELPAVKKQRVFVVDGSAFFNRSGPRLVDGLEILAQIIHPEIFSWNVSSAMVRRVEL
jgi:iron complex transport system substrate-binding protein